MEDNSAQTALLSLWITEERLDSDRVIPAYIPYGEGMLRKKVSFRPSIRSLLMLGIRMRRVVPFHHPFHCWASFRPNPQGIPGGITVVYTRVYTGWCITVVYTLGVQGATYPGW